MSDETDKTPEQEQLERRRLSRLIDALPVFSGFTSPDGHLLRIQPETDEAFLWNLPSFSYAHESITQIVDLCERAAGGHHVQIERPYRKSSSGDQNSNFGRGLLTLSPIIDDKNTVEELAVTFLDCDEHQLTEQDDFAKIRLVEVNRRIDSMLSLAQTLIEASVSPGKIEADRDQLYKRLDALASIIDVVSDPDLDALSVENLIDMALDTLPAALKRQRLQRLTSGGEIPIATLPFMILLLTELSDNACQYGAWREKDGPHCGTVSIQSEMIDTSAGRFLRLHWLEDGGPSVPAILNSGFGMTLGERLFPEITGGTSTLLKSEDGINWTFQLPLPDVQNDFGFSGDDV